MRISDWSSDVCSSDLVLHDVAAAGVRGGALTAHARIEGLGFAAQGDAPGISGLSGVLDGDAEGLSFKFDPQATLRFDWPSEIGRAHVCTPVTNAQLVCRLLLEKKNSYTNTQYPC